MKPVCLVLGAGAGIGGTVATKFADEGYYSYLCRSCLLYTSDAADE